MDSINTPSDNNNIDDCFFSSGKRSIKTVSEQHGPLYMGSKSGKLQKKTNRQMDH